MILPPEAHPLVQVLALHFTSPTCQRLSTLLAGAVLTTGRRTVANLLRTLRQLAPGHPTDYRRVLSELRGPGSGSGCALVRFLLDHVVPAGPVMVVGDDTVDGHKGRTRLRQGPTSRRRSLDPLLHRLAVRAQVGGSCGPGGVPVRQAAVGTAGTDRPVPRPRLDRAEKAAPTDPAPTHVPTAAPVACSASRTGPSYSPGIPGTAPTRWPGSATATAGRLTLVSKCHPDANLFDPPPPYARQRAGRGSRGIACPSPAQAAQPPAAPGWRSGGTAGASGGSKRRPGPGTGTKAGAGWSRCGGCSSATRPARTGTSTSSPPTRPARRTRSSATTAVAGASRPPSRRAASALGLGTTRGRCKSTVLARPVPARAVHRGRDPVPRPARVEAGRCGGVAREGDRHVLRRPVRGAAVAMGRSRFTTGGRRHGP